MGGRWMDGWVIRNRWGGEVRGVGDSRMRHGTGVTREEGVDGGAGGELGRREEGLRGREGAGQTRWGVGRQSVVERGV